MEKKAWLENAKKNLPLALPTGLACGFTFFFFGPFDIFAGNITEFRFAFSDFGWWLLLLAVGVSLLVGAALTFLPRKVFPVVFGLFLWLVVMGYVQGTFLNTGLGSLMGDNGEVKQNVGLLIFNTALWVITGAGFVVASLLMQKYELIRTIATILLIMVLGMQLVGCISQFGTVFGGSEAASGEAADPAPTEERFLSTYGLNEVAEKSNIVIIILDRFDVTYYERLLTEDPTFFSDMEALNGFTLYTDNVMLYSRTYPAATSIITGLPQVDTNGKDFGWSASQYFSHAYSHSPFLNDLKDNGYHIRLYMDPYYTYRDADALIGCADNVTGSNGYIISDTGKLVGDMLGLSAYRYLPHLFKPLIKVTTASFNDTVKYLGHYAAYSTNDPDVFKLIKENGLVPDGNEKTFTYLHLAGCHAPCTMDADGNYKEGASVTEALCGCFNLISMYIDELKRLGVYDDTTILITGDHPAARSDTKLIAEPRLSPVFFKPAHAENQPLRESTAQVSQENLLPSLVKAAGLTTTHDYGTAYADVPEGVDVTRYHKFEVKLDDQYYIAEYTVTGDGHDFKNWSRPRMIEIDSLYR